MAAGYDRFAGIDRSPRFTQALNASSIFEQEAKIDQQARGTRILYGGYALLRRAVINNCFRICDENGFMEIVLPSIEPAEIYEEKAGDGIVGQMYTFKDKGDRDICLRPEGTATCQLLAKQEFKDKKDVMLCYEVRCWRYERPQAGRYREFTQFGVEILNPTRNYKEELLSMAEKMLPMDREGLEVNSSVKRGLAYYIDNGFEIACPYLGAQKQLVGGGAYDEGIGFAIGIDRLLLAMAEEDKRLETPEECDRFPFLPAPW